MMEEAVIAMLLADGGVAALVSDRVFPGRRFQGSALPAVVIHRIDGARSYTVRGPVNLVSSRLQIDSWGRTYTEAKLLARAVVAVLNGARDDATGIQGVFIDGERDLGEAGSNQAEYLHRTMLDMSIWHTE